MIRCMVRSRRAATRDSSSVKPDSPPAMSSCSSASNRSNLCCWNNSHNTTQTATPSKIQPRPIEPRRRPPRLQKKSSHANRCLDQKAKAGDPGCLLIREVVLSHGEGASQSVRRVGILSHTAQTFRDRTRKDVAA